MSNATVRPEVAADFNDLAGAKRWIMALVKTDMSFHFEDDPATIVRGRTGALLFTDAEVPVVNDRVAKLYGFEWGPEYGCPIGYEIECTSWVYGDRKDEPL